MVFLTTKLKRTKMKNIIVITVFTLLCGIYSCTKLDDPSNPIGINNILRIEYLNDDSTLIADGKDKIEIHVILNDTNVSANMLVKFTTAQGTFVGASDDGKSITVRADGYDAKVILQSDVFVNDRVQMTVKIGDFVDYFDVNYKRSYPEEILVQASKFQLTADQSDRIYLTPNLRKAIGSVSTGTKVEFEVITVAGNPDINVQPIYWNETTLNRAELMTTSSDTGNIQVVTKVFNGSNFIVAQDTLDFTVE